MHQNRSDTAAPERPRRAARRDVRELVAANDPALRRLIEAEDDDARDAEIERLLSRALRPLPRIAAAGDDDAWAFDAADAEDVAATAALRLVGRLRSVAVSAEDAIASFAAYVETVVHHAAQEVVRRRFPERHRLRNRLRYLLTRDARFAMWRADDGRTYAALARSRGATPSERTLTRAEASRTACDAARPADALLAILQHLRTPVPFERLVGIAADLWSVTEKPAAVPEPDRSDALSHLIARHSLASLWREIRELRPRQRAALLLNLRAEAGVNALGLILLAGVATFDELAAAADLPAERLAAIWNELPLDDLSIAAILAVTRQQVINLRKCARDRLRRRLGVAR
jgi:hypothetical protein